MEWVDWSGSGSIGAGVEVGVEVGVGSGFQFFGLNDQRPTHPGVSWVGRGTAGGGLVLVWRVGNVGLHFVNFFLEFSFGFPLLISWVSQRFHIK